MKRIADTLVDLIVEALDSKLFRMFALLALIAIGMRLFAWLAGEPMP